MARFEGSKHQQQLQLFSIGTEVEVRSDEEGFKGVWFRATIVTSPTNSASKKRKRALVEYKSLVTEDGSQQLKEYVDSVYMRPLPPQLGDGKFEEGDVVDADYKDGWWTGIVGKVLDNHSKYRVVFENPPDLIEFERERLRLHQDWVSGKWVRPNKKEVSATSEPGQDLALVLHTENNSNHHEVATQVEISGAAEDNPESTNSEKNLVEQPSCPRSIKEKKMLARNVSTQDSGPLKKLKADKATEATLTVSARQLRNMPDNKEILHELATVSRGVRGTRRSRKPVDGHQGVKTESLLVENNVAKQDKDGAVDNQWIHPVTSKGRRTKSQVATRLTEAGYICALPTQKRGKEKGKGESAGATSARKVAHKEGITQEPEVPLNTGSKAKEKEGSLAKNPCQVPEEDLRMSDQKKNGNDPAREKSTVMSAELGSDSILANLLRSLVLFPDMEFKQQPAGGSSHKRKRGRPRKLAVPSPQALVGVKGQNGSANAAGSNVSKDLMLVESPLQVIRGMDTTDSQDASRRKIVEFPVTRCVMNEATRISNEASDITDDDDRPLSMWFGGMQCPGIVGESRPSPDRNVEQHSDKREPIESMESPAVGVNGSGVDEKRCLPFVKTSPVWKTLETIEVFRVIPQNPHFIPLSTCKEDHREGSAIGSMITFSRLAEKISRLHFEDPRDVFDSILESLADMEKYGFSVTVLRGRVNDLLSIKDRQGRFEVESKDAERKIVENSLEKTGLMEESDSIAKKIIELEEKQASVKSELEARDKEIGRLQIHMDSMNEGIQSARSDFEKLASVPFG